MVMALSILFLIVGSQVLGIRYAWDSYPQSILYNVIDGPNDPIMFSLFDIRVTFESILLTTNTSYIDIGTFYF